MSSSDTPEELVSIRHSIQGFCELHFESVMAFHAGTSFKLNPDEKLGRRFRHITTAATCLESLRDCPKRYWTGQNDPLQLVKEFALRAINQRDARWRSEGSAHIYCRCRALPLVVTGLGRIHQKVVDHLRFIFYQLDQDHGRFAVGEAAKKTPPSNWYPPNAFHTYWTLELLDRLSRVGATTAQWWESIAADQRRRAMLLWARQKLGQEIALHDSISSTLDTDQLAWALAIVMRFGDPAEASTTKNRRTWSTSEKDFMRQALHCLFATQLPVGTWHHYGPLFHYRDVGNAYSYVFETFTVLLKTALSDRSGFFIKEFRPYSSNLIRLWKYADVTRIPISEDGKQLGWFSGHRTNQLQPEGWATASVFAYAQALRRLIGVWVREEAISTLNQIRVYPSRSGALKDILERGNTWELEGESVARQLVPMFVNPLEWSEVEEGAENRMDPDFQPIESDQARSAIFFGPPGTSKTSLARAVAGAIGWDYVELHASHFVADGLPRVQKTADRIFGSLMELDHVVVLFDEIDELVREREMEADAFGRFLTTSMLPKLAQLWHQRKIIYFVAANHIGYFDAAITRSQRFDAVLLVGPPSLTAKVKELKKYLAQRGRRKVSIELSKNQVEQAFRQAAGSSQKVDDEAEIMREHILAKFMLLRHDQLKELALNLHNPATTVISRQEIEIALEDIADIRLKRKLTYCRYLKDIQYSRPDRSHKGVWEVIWQYKRRKLPNTIKKVGDRYWHTTSTGKPDPQFRQVSPGRLKPL